MSLLIAISLVGALAHNVMEFGWGGLASADTMSIPVILVWIGLAYSWARWPDRRQTLARIIVALVLLNLVVGAVISVLPLSILPFDPEQTTYHYSAHVIMGVTQLPLLGMLLYVYAQQVAARP